MNNRNYLTSVKKIILSSYLHQEDQYHQEHFCKNFQSILELQDPIKTKHLGNSSGYGELLANMVQVARKF